MTYFIDIRIFSMKISNILSYNNLLKVLPKIGSNDIGRWCFNICLSPFLRTGTTFVFFHSIENFPLSKQDWKINFRGLQIEVSQILIIADVLFSILLPQMCRAKFWKVNATYSYSFREPSCRRPQSVPKRCP